MPRCAATEDFFRLRLDQMIDLSRSTISLDTDLRYKE